MEKNIQRQLKQIGLKQGDPLNKTLFNIYINDLLLILEKTTRSFENRHLGVPPFTSLLFVVNPGMAALTEMELLMNIKIL